jgi:hypothetical protein
MEECCLLENKYDIAKTSLSEVLKILKQQNKSGSEESDRHEINIREVSACYFSAYFFSSEYHIHAQKLVFV